MEESSKQIVIAMRKKQPQYQNIGKRELKLNDPLFSTTVYILLNFTSEDWFNWQAKKGVVNSEPDSRGFSAWTVGLEDTKSGVITHAVCLRQFEWSISDQATLIHELTHVTFRIFQANNIPFNADTQEFIACMIDRLYEMVASKIFGLTKRDTRKKG